MTRPSLLLTRRWPSAVETVLAQTYDVSFNPEDRAMTSIAIADALRDFDYVCPTVSDQIDADMLTGRPVRTKALCNFGAGVGHIDLAACASAGLLVTNTPDVLTDDTADLAMLLALMCARRAGEGERLVRRAVARPKPSSRASPPGMFLSISCSPMRTSSRFTSQEAHPTAIWSMPAAWP
jgi:lactate dehydrogenase-like 2-hydroxyacid dehydrogenase